MREPNLPPHVVIDKMVALAREEGYGVENVTLKYHHNNYKLTVDTEMIDYTEIGGVS